MMVAANVSDAQALGSGKAPGSRQARRVGRPGQGIIDANRKTEMCRHWMSGACPFGVKCAFAHGAQELRSLAADTERTRFNATGTTTSQFQNVVTGDPAALCCDPWCTARHDRIMCSTDTSRLLPGSKDDFYRAPRTNDRGLDGFLRERPVASGAVDDLNLPMNRLRLDSQQTRPNRRAAHTGDMSREGFSVWESSDPMFQGAAPGRTEAARRKYKVDEESSHRVFDKANSRAERGEAPHRVFDKANSRAERREAPRRVLDKVNNSRAERVELPRRAYDDVNTNAASARPVALTTAVAKDGLRGSIRGRETWAKVARGGYGPPCNDPLCMQGNPNGELMEAGCRSGESSRPRPVVGCEPRHDTAPRTCEFSYFQSRRASHRAASVPPKRSSSGRSAPSVSAAPPTAGNAVGWDPIRYDARHFGDASTALCEGKKKAVTGVGRASLTMQQRLDEDGTSAGMVSALLEIAKTRPRSERPTTPWCASSLPPTDEPSSDTRLDAVEMPRSSRFSRGNGTRVIPESTRAMPTTARESNMAQLNNGWQPMLRHNNPSGPSTQVLDFKYDGAFQVVTGVPNIPRRPTFA